MRLSSIQQQCIVCQSPKQLEIRTIGIIARSLYTLNVMLGRVLLAISCLRNLLSVSDYVKRLVWSVHFRPGLTDVVAVNHRKSWVDVRMSK